MDLTVVWATAHQPAAHTPVEAVRVVLLVLEVHSKKIFCECEFLLFLAAVFVSSRSFGLGPRFCGPSRGSSFKQIPSVRTQSSLSQSGLVSGPDD